MFKKLKKFFYVTFTLFCLMARIKTTGYCNDIPVLKTVILETNTKSEPITPFCNLPEIF